MPPLHAPSMANLSLLLVPSPGILKVPPLTDLPSHRLLASLFTYQNQLEAGSLSQCLTCEHVDSLVQTILGTQTNNKLQAALGQTHYKVH